MRSRAVSSNVIAAAPALVPALVMVLAGQALAQPVTNPAELIQQDRLMATLKELPTSRAAMGDEASREGLRKTETLISQKLTELGYTPVMQEFKWALPARDWPTPDSAKPDPAKPDSDKARCGQARGHEAGRRIPRRKHQACRAHLAQHHCEHSGERASQRGCPDRGPL